MNWENLDNVRSVAMETFDVGGAHVPGNELTERSILHKNPVAQNEGLWDWIPVHLETFERHLTYF